MSPAVEQRLAAGVVWALVACAVLVAGLPVAWALHVLATSLPLEELSLLEIWLNLVAVNAGLGGVAVWILLALYARTWARGAAAAMLRTQPDEEGEQE